MNQPFTQSLIVAEILKQWPETIPVFIRHHMSCVGCSMSSFETLSDATRIYGIPYEAFIVELQSAIAPANSSQNSGE